ncbi:MAG: D-alanyl-D-alanine carboxypeptidase/D-alanyl-D-alanine-endopeptidase [Nitrosomonadales bacterium]|nr:D-alanyl-D-alanine carboxypeptidase/D-alanyl-D-alanine-endopeptidase [Nitrosomonadales bacterium]
MRNFFIGLTFCSLLSGVAHAVALPESVSASLKRAHIPPSSVAIVVQEVQENSPIISLNAERAMNPASTMKLLTTFAALETLGPAYRWKTEAYLNGRLENGVLQGDLVFKGYGDPKLTVEQFWMWLRELRQRGLREIRGDLVLDRSFFEDSHHDPAEFDNDPTRAYNVGTNALLLNFNAQHLHLIPNGHATTALLEPELAGYSLVNRITTSAKLRCGGDDAYKARLDGHSIVLEGNIPAACGEADDYFSLLPHDEYFFSVFGALWHELGGTLQGKLRLGLVPADQPPFARYVSPPLSEVIRDINKFSNNTMARQLFLSLGAADTIKNAVPVPQVVVPAENGSNLNLSDAQAPEETTLPAQQGGGDSADVELPIPSPAPDAAPLPVNIARSTVAIRQWLKSRQLQFPELVLENGAGLSRKERISARHLAGLLQRVTGSPFRAELEASLPILGMDGTLTKRFKNSEIAGYGHLKTGSLEGVKSLAGYVKSHSGKQWIVVFLINHPNAASGQHAQDALIEWLQKSY